jgi:hypothetical protein
MSTFSPGNPFVGEGLPGPSTKKRINVGDKGKRAERQLATWWRAHGFPVAARHVKTGDRFTPDEGDLVLVHGDFRLVVEVKHHAGGLTDGQVTEYGQKLVTKQVPQSNGAMGILVERRDRVSDPGCWWVHIDPFQFGQLEIGYPDHNIDSTGIRWHPLACRTTVGYFARLLTNAGLAGPHTTEE